MGLPLLEKTQGEAHHQSETLLLEPLLRNDFSELW